jgi:hypothetical protein
MKAIRAYETSETIYLPTQRRVTEDGNSSFYLCEKLDTHLRTNFF